MKVHVVVLPRRGILDPQGKTISEALQNTGFDSVSNVRAGKFFELEIDTDSTAQAEEAGASMARTLLANPVTEDFRVVIPSE